MQDNVPPFCFYNRWQFVAPKPYFKDIAFKIVLQFLSQAQDTLSDKTL